jgi:hypothetical protein
MATEPANDAEHTAPHIDQLRTHLMDTLAALRDRDNPMEVDRARAVAQVATVLVETAKVEVEFLRVTNSDKSRFLGASGEPDTPALPSGYKGGTVERLAGVTRHTA